MTSYSKHLSDFYIAGTRYWDAALVIDELHVGEALTLKAELDNAYDPDAVAIYFEDTKLGFVPRVNNGFIAQLLHFGHTDVVECRILRVDPTKEPSRQILVGLYIIDKTED